MNMQNYKEIKYFNDTNRETAFVARGVFRDLAIAFSFAIALYINALNYTVVSKIYENDKYKNLRNLQKLEDELRDYPKISIEIHGKKLESEALGKIFFTVGMPGRKLAYKIYDK